MSTSCWSDGIAGLAHSQVCCICTTTLRHVLHAVKAGPFK